MEEMKGFFSHLNDILPVLGKMLNTSVDILKLHHDSEIAKSFLPLLKLLHCYTLSTENLEKNHIMLDIANEVSAVNETLSRMNIGLRIVVD